MGVFVTGRQVALEIDMPGWWLTNASVDMDFRRGLYYDSSTANPRAATDFLSCTRASIGYAKNSDGTLTSFASNALRIGIGTGLLVEDSRSNYLQQSQTFSDAQWTKDGSSVGSTTTAPDGTSTAIKLVESATNATHRAYNQVTGGFLTNPVSWSVYAKAAERSWVALRNNSAAKYANFDLTNGVVGTTNTTATIEVLGSSGWYRCTMSGAPAAANDFCTINMGTADTGSADPPTYNGDGTSGLYLWGVQVENGAFPSSYIPTTSTSATRAADAVTLAGNLSTVMLALPHSVVADVIVNQPSTTIGFNRIVGDNTGTAAELHVNNGDTLVGIYNGSVVLGATIGSSLTFTGGVKVGSCQNVSGRSVVGGGGTVATDANNHTSSAILLGHGASGTDLWFGYFRRLTAWNTRLADATLQALTAP